MAWISSSAVFSMGDGWAVYAGAHEDHVAHPCRNPADRGSRGLGPRGSGRPSALSRQAIVIGPSGADRAGPRLVIPPSPTALSSPEAQPDRIVAGFKEQLGVKVCKLDARLEGALLKPSEDPAPGAVAREPGRSAPQGPGLGADAGSTSLLRSRDFPWVFRPVHQPVGSSLGQVPVRGPHAPGQARSACPIGPTTREDILGRSPNQSDRPSREISCASAMRVREG